MTEEERKKAEWLKPYHFQPGQSGNPAGRKSAGASLKEMINSMVEADLTEEQLRDIALDRKKGVVQRSAANRLLVLMERGDLADVEDFLNGNKSIRELREMGEYTDLIKKAKVTKKTFKTEGGDNVEVESREIELHDRSGEEFDRISDRTDGKPTQAVDLNHAGLPTSVQIVTPLTSGGSDVAFSEENPGNPEHDDPEGAGGSPDV